MKRTRKTCLSWSKESLEPIFAHMFRNTCVKYTGPHAAQREANELAEHLISQFAARPVEVQAFMCTSAADRLLKAAFDMRTTAPQYSERLRLASAVMAVMGNVKRYGMTGVAA